MDGGQTVRQRHRLEDLLRSDFLPLLVALKEAFPAFAALFPELLQLRLVVDANRVQAELRWRLRRRRNPAARSSLHEVIDAGVLVLFAPAYVKYEIEKHYQDIAGETGTSVSDVSREWALFQKCLCFYVPKNAPSPTESYADLDDFAYLAAWRELDRRGVYTEDRHLAAMGAPVVSVLIDTHLREYARASTVQIAVRVGSSFSVIVGWEFLRVVYRLFVQCLRAIRKLPSVAQLSLGAVCVISVAHPQSRAKLKEGWIALKNSEAVLNFCDHIVDLGMEAADASRRARASYGHLQSVLPAKSRRPLLLHARSVCVEAGSALSLDELERRIRRGGYVSRSRNFRQYLRRVLANDEFFAEVTPGHWELQG